MHGLRILLIAATGAMALAGCGGGNIFAIHENSAGGVTPDVLLSTSNRIVTFAEDTDGELYFVDIAVGTIHKLEDAP